MPAAMATGAIVTIGAGIASFFVNKNKADAMEKNANAAYEEAKKAYDKMVSLANEQYDRWQEDFGEIQTEVADYYKELTDASLKQQYEDANTEANQSLIQQYFAAQSSINSSMNKAGMANSGAAQSSTLQLQQTMLSQKAQNRWQTQQLKANANNTLMGQKANWVQQGESLRNQAMQNQYNAQQILGNASQAQGNMYTQLQHSYQQQAINSGLGALANLGGQLTGAGATIYSAELSGTGTGTVDTSSYLLSDSQAQNIVNSTLTPYTFNIGSSSSANSLQTQMQNYNFIDSITSSTLNNTNTSRANSAKLTQDYFKSAWGQ